MTISSTGSALSLNRYFSDDPNTCLIKLRQFAELLAQDTAAGVGVVVGEATNFADLLRQLRFEGRLDERVRDIFHQLRRDGNESAHSFSGGGGWRRRR